MQSQGFVRRSRIQYSPAAPRNPHRYPPVGPNSTAMPPRKPENTGRPATPSSRYTTMVAVPSRPPRSSRVKNRAKVCILMAWSPMGTLSHAHMASTAASTAQRVIFLSFILTPALRPYHIICREKRQPPMQDGYKKEKLQLLRKYSTKTHINPGIMLGKEGFSGNKIYNRRFHCLRSSGHDMALSAWIWFHITEKNGHFTP